MKFHMQVACFVHWSIVMYMANRCWEQGAEASAVCRVAAYDIVRVAYQSVPPQLLKSRVMESVGGNKVRAKLNNRMLSTICNEYVMDCSEKLGMIGTTYHGRIAT
jgi:hypothetical protein